jgi:hypothetical protein
MKVNKKAEWGSSLTTLVISVLIIAVLGGIGGKLVSDLQPAGIYSPTNATTQVNASWYGQAAINTTLSYLGLIVIVGIIGVIIFLLLRSFAPMLGKGGL